jgi:hypothetical protein
MTTGTNKRNQWSVSVDDFVKTWGEVHAEGGDVEDFCRRTGLPKAIAQAYASELRSAKVPLPKLRRTNAAKPKPQEPPYDREKVLDELIAAAMTED